MISDYNNKVIPKIVEYIKYFLQRIEASSEGSSIKVKRFESINTENYDINYLIVHGLTGKFTVKVFFENTVNGTATEFSEDLEIPKMINNIFIIEGTLRVPTNTLDNDDEVTVYDYNVRLNEFVNIMYEEDEHENDGYKLTIYIYEDEEPTVIDGTEENFNKYREYLKMTQAEQDKLKVKLDTDEIGEYLTRDYVTRLIELGSDKLHDNMIDKKIYSPESNLMKYLWTRDVRKKILTNMKSKYFQYSRIFLRDIQNAINRYFLVASEKNIDFPSTVNPLIFDAMKFKIVIPENVAFNKTMTDIIDVANTPINTNVNRINELNVCSVIKDDVIYIKCYTYPDQTPIEIPYTHYCTKKVILNQYWDYDKKTFKDGIKSLNYKLRLNIKTGYTNEKYDYIEPKADDKLSITTRRIPLGNISDSVRVSMGATMEKQAVELDDSQQALVSAGHDDEDFELSTLITSFKGDNGIVDKIEDNKIFVKDPFTGSIQFFEIPSPTPSANDSVISFDSAVKVGDTIKKDDVIILPHMFKNREFELGINSNIVYLNYLGYTHEDGVVISESYADRMIHYSIIDVYKDIYPDDIIRFIRKIGSKVTSKDILVNDQTRLRVNKALKDTYTGGGLLAGMGIEYNQSNLIVPNNIDEGYVLDVKIVILDGRTITSEVTQKTIDDFVSDSKIDEYTRIPDKYKSLHANEVEVSDKVAGYISYKLIRVDRCKIGDKVTNRYGSKGIVSLVLPDECMPQVVHEDGTKTPVEVVLNPASVLHRKNLSQLYECALSKCITAIYERVSKLVADENIDAARQLLSKYSKVYGNRFTSMTDAEFINYHNTKGIFAYKMNVGFYSKVTYEEVLGWMKELGVKETDRIFLPDVLLVETKSGLKGFNPEKYVKSETDLKSTLHELGWCDQPCITGKEYIMKLWKQANYDGKVTSEVLDTEEPVMGKGKYRWEGQKIGEMELWILLETGIEKFIQDQSETMKTSQYQFLNELLLSGYFIQDKSGNPLLSNTRTREKALEDLTNT